MKRLLPLIALVTLAACKSEPAPKPDDQPTEPSLACEPEDGRACLVEGMRFESGFGRSRSLDSAARHYAAACDAGEPLGCYNLGAMLYAADSEENAEQARSLYQQACEAGEPKGCANLAFLESRAGETQRAAELYSQACDAGAMIGCTNLADMHQSGRGVEQDTRQAAELFERACWGGINSACIRRAWLEGQQCLDSPDGCASPAETEKQAAQQVGEACEAWGSPWACVAFGTHLQGGRLVQRDRDKARALFDQACEDGNAWGCERLGITLAEGRGGPRDMEAAKLALEQSCEESFAAGCTGLAGFFIQDKMKRPRGLELLHRACDAHEDSSCNTLMLYCHAGEEPACR